MSDAREPQSVLDAAEQAASAGDYASAEALLREAADLQEATLGPVHPDLANTLNNLGIVCEITGKPDDAEHNLRRAYAIAMAALDPGHPLVATSRRNLEEFCAAQGKPLEPPPLSADAEDVDVPTTASSDLGTADLPGEVQELGSPGEVQALGFSEEVQAYAPPDEVQAVESRTERRSPVVGLLVAVALLIVVVATWLNTGQRGASIVEPPLRSPDPPAQTPAAGAAAIASDPPAETAHERGAPREPQAKTSESPVASTPPAKSRDTAAPASDPPSVASAQLCQDLSTRGRRGSVDWPCIPASSPVAPGTLFFYTRITSPVATTVRHRWYHGGRLRQSVELSVRPNTASGYRTYSRLTIGDQATGDWRVALSTKDGVPLHEERFVVR